MGIEDLKDELHSLLLQRSLVDSDIERLKCDRKFFSIEIKRVQKEIKRELRINERKSNSRM